MVHPYLVLRYRLDGIVTVVDAVNGLGTLDAHPEAVKQAAVADRIVLSKTDLVATPEQISATEQLRHRLRALNPAAPILDAAAHEASPAKLINCGLYDPNQKIPDVNRWLAEEAYTTAHNADHHHRHHHDPNRHDDRIRAFTLATDAAIPAATFDMFLELLRAAHGPNLLRVKGVVKLAEQPESPLVVHGVQHVFHPPARLERWPDQDRRTRLVFIVQDMLPSTVQQLFDAFLGRLAPDQPDRAAITDNPLVPFGGTDH
jgi:G3E family GTPase